MGLPYSLFARPFLRFVDSEKAHDLAIRGLSTFGQSSGGQRLLSSLYHAPELPIHVFGRLFHHPLGLAAGFDKGAEALSAWPALGFSWLEYGGVTRFPQDGNPKPRMFRAESENALVNRMGFNNPGASAVRDSLISRRSSGKWPKVPVAANIGRSKKTPNESAPSDYSQTLDILWNHADIFVLNVSSPNTPGLRELQEVDHLSSILSECGKVAERKGGGKPLLLKLSPDGSDDEIIASAQMALRRGIDGFVATNTTLHRPVPSNTRSRGIFAESGGLSGRPLQSRSVEVIRLLYEEVGSEVPIVGVGGIDSAATAWEAMTSGASLLQLYSALVFKGPSVVPHIVKGLRRKIRDNGFLSIEEAVGYSNP